MWPKSLALDVDRLWGRTHVYIQTTLEVTVCDQMVGVDMSFLEGALGWNPKLVTWTRRKVRASSPGNKVCQPTFRWYSKWCTFFNNAWGDGYRGVLLTGFSAPTSFPKAPPHSVTPILTFLNHALARSVLWSGQPNSHSHFAIRSSDHCTHSYSFFESKGQQSLSVKWQIRNIFSLAGHIWQL